VIADTRMRYATREYWTRCVCMIRQARIRASDPETLAAKWSHHRWGKKPCGTLNCRRVAITFRASASRYCLKHHRAEASASARRSRRRAA